ncbi:integral membrane protein, partial [Mycobacterium sp. PO1]
MTDGRDEAESEFDAAARAEESGWPVRPAELDSPAQPAGLESPARPEEIEAPARLAGMESPARLAGDLRSLDDRDLPSRTDTIGAALAGTIGGPVGRHALIGRTRFLTPLRVMMLIALVFLALGYSTKAACLQTTGSGTAEQR